MCYDRCSVCGSPITDTNPDGIGYGCRGNIVEPARKDWRMKAHGLEFWGKKCEAAMIHFIEKFGQRKFRKEGFKKSFTASIIAQWNEKKRMSKKQFDIVLRMLEEEHVYTLSEEFAFIYKNWFKKLMPDPTGPEYDYYKERFEMHKKLYLSGRKGQQEDYTPIVEKDDE